MSEMPSGVAFVEAGGVGYALLVSQSTEGQLKIGEDTRLYAYEHIREDTHELYGFLSYEDKLLFEKLISVNGVGPRMALSIMNLGASSEVRRSIAQSNVVFLTRASGVGRRLAERIVVDLKDTFAEGVLMEKFAGEDSGRGDDALQALVSLGYNRVDAIAALDKAGDGTTEERIKKALKEVS